MVRNAFCGSRSVSTVAVSEYEGNFSPIPNIVFSPSCGTMTLKSELTLYASSQRVKDIYDAMRITPSDPSVAKRGLLGMTGQIEPPRNQVQSSTKCHIRYILDSSWMPRRFN